MALREFAGKYFRNLSRLIPTLLDNSSVYLRGKKAARGPLAVVWDITDKCNLNCIFCNQWKIEPQGLVSDKKGLNSRQKIEIIQKLSESGAWLLSFCGGEPLLCEDLPLLIKEAKASRMLVNISTNGLLLEERAKDIMAAGIDSVTISIDSHHPEVLARIRGNEGLFNAIDKGIKEVRKLSENKSIFIEARCLINKQNCFLLEELVSRWQKIVDSFLLKPIYENPLLGYSVPAEMRFEPDEGENFRKYFADFLKKHKKIDNPYHRLIPDFFFNGNGSLDCFSCFAGTFFGALDSRGNLYPCREMTCLPNPPLGNLLEEDFLALWNSQGVCAIREAFKQNLRCNCWLDRFLPSIYLERFLNPLNKLINYDQKKKPKVL
ncbi:MAG: radical SAM protein [Candidatus Omnitrophota bacterium]